jgi:hypothetical protein
MANTYYNSQLTAEEIEEVLEAINGILNPANNGKVLAISNGKFEARSVQWGGGEPTIEPLSVTENGTYTAPTGVDGYSPITVNVPGSSAVVQPLSVTQNGTYNPPSGVDGYSPVTVNVSGGSTPLVIYSNDRTLAAFIDLTNNRVVWYFMGFTKTSNDVDIPSEIFIGQSGLLYSKAYGSDKETQIGQIGFYNGRIRSWNTSTSQTMGGTFWGVVYSNGGQGQTNPYSDPPQ